jgi:hypothetical protein
MRRWRRRQSWTGQGQPSRRQSRLYGQLYEISSFFTSIMHTPVISDGFIMEADS